MKWTMTDKDSSKRVFAVLLTDGLWHQVKNGSFQAEDGEEDQYATWIADDAFRMACPLTSIAAMKVVIYKA